MLLIAINIVIRMYKSDLENHNLKMENFNYNLMSLFTVNHFFNKRTSTYS